MAWLRGESAPRLDSRDVRWMCRGDLEHDGCERVEVGCWYKRGRMVSLRLHGSVKRMKMGPTLHFAEAKFCRPRLHVVGGGA